MREITKAVSAVHGTRPLLPDPLAASFEAFEIVRMLARSCDHQARRPD